MKYLILTILLNLFFLNAFCSPGLGDSEIQKFFLKIYSFCVLGLFLIQSVLYIGIQKYRNKKIRLIGFPLFAVIALALPIIMTLFNVNFI